ncbi:unnamed protein product [Lepeophtheirus salmonis]|uniref:(salmon louse) hypothetical protein n=1 Tax=Lepeophtheirus salmonis TaxID=72036 RepID=A0A7R8H5Z1_LEPSM|nr:unnamed protein product [Lepeophtheirus salmonis]CAF2876195.1 unnamed protein product [Lepeophtheirus salmonis]
MEVIFEKYLELKTNLSQPQAISIKVDIWSDRKISGYIGITVYWVTKAIDMVQLKSNLLTFERIKGSYTAEKIYGLVDTSLNQFEIKQKLKFLISDNASNMQKAFTLYFPCDEEDSDDEYWYDLNYEDHPLSKIHYLKCFAHFL